MGRRRLFDVEHALEIAMRAFWLHGYEGTNLSDICDQVGIGKPSLYRVFTSKVQLFDRVLERYEQQHLGFVSRALAAPTAYDVARLLLQGLVRTFTLPEMPHGALDLNACAACTGESLATQKKLDEWRAAYETMLVARFAEAKNRGDLRADFTPKQLARYLMSIAAGIAHQAKAGASRRELYEVADLALFAVAAATAHEMAQPKPAKSGMVGV